VTGVSGDPLSSPIQALYRTIKTGLPGLKDYRPITFGIAPIALADTSGANNIKRITFRESLANAKVGRAKKLPQRYYNGYRFHKKVMVEKMLYNTTLTLFFLGNYFEDSEFREIVQNWKETGLRSVN
jgi:hypothetical protein